MDRNGTINKNVFFLLIAKNKQTTVNNKKNNNKPRPLLRFYVSVIIFVVKLFTKYSKYLITLYV
jgi:hypothetical protein